MESGVSVDEPVRYLTYYLVVGIFVALPLAFGRRAGCHYVCWMARFMTLGRSLRNVAGWPSLRLASDAARCSGCQKGSRACPMSLDTVIMGPVADQAALHGLPDRVPDLGLTLVSVNQPPASP